MTNPRSRPLRLRHAGPLIDVSVVIPIHDERDNLEPLLEALDASVPAAGGHHEYVLVDDGSTDGSGELLDRLATQRHDLVVVHLRRCFGQTAALEAGIRASSGDVLVFMDADLQNDPADVPAMLERLQQGYDVVHGWRRTRHDVFWSRRLPSIVANRLIRWLTGVRVHDLGCAIRVMRRDLAEELPLEGDMHRFIAVLADARGARWTEMPVHHRPRTRGASKYGLSRTFRVVVDLVMLCWFTRLAVPLTRLLVGVGLTLIALAAVLPATAVILAAAGRTIAWPAWAAATVAAAVGGVNLVGVGIVAATSVSTWWRARDLRPWSVRQATASAEEHMRRAA
jgi:hypothetical protein